MSKNPNACPNCKTGKVILNKWGTQARCFSCGYAYEIEPEEYEEEAKEEYEEKP